VQKNHIVPLYLAVLTRIKRFLYNNKIGTKAFKIIAYKANKKIGAKNTTQPTVSTRLEPVIVLDL